MRLKIEFIIALIYCRADTLRVEIFINLTIIEDNVLKNS